MAASRIVAVLSVAFALFILGCFITGTDAQYSPKFLDVPLNPRLAAIGEIFANATCGTGTKEEFCKLVDHVKDKDKVEHCDYCDASIIEKRHPIQYAIDGSNNWWQSPSLARGLKYHSVDIVLNLRQIYQIHWIIIKAANAPRPGNWILEKSTDGKVFKPWMYFASSIEQCKSLYSVSAVTEQPEPMLTSDDEVYCTTYFSRPRPVENGEIHIALTKGRPGARHAPLPAKLIEFMSAQYIRLRLQRILTLFGDRMVLPDENDSSVYRRYFYSLKDISVGGRCICYNHATDCTRQSTGKMACNCMHNTCGDHCERCCPKFNQKVWQPEKPCEECNCHNHAFTCVYNQTVANLRLSLNKKNKYEGGGQCVDCQDNTAGVNCQSCKDGYYRPSTVLPTKPRPCIPCNCRSVGSTGSCVPDDSRIASGLVPGKCICRAGFTGDDCDECTVGHRRVNYPPYCVPCACGIQGSKRDKYSCYVPCNCKENVDELSQCRKCKPGFFNLQMTNPKGCSECFCFGVARECKSSKWGAVPISSMKGWKVTNIDGDKTVKPAMTRQGFPIVTSVETKRTFGSTGVFYWSAPQEYLGNLVTSYGSSLSYIIGFSTDDSSVPVPRPGYEVIIEGDGYRLSYRNVLPITNGRPQVMSVRLSEETPWEVTRDPSGRLVPDKRTVMIVLANVTRILLRGQYVSSQVIGDPIIDILLRNVTIVKAYPGAPISMSSVEVCKCPSGYSGTSCETCAPGFRRVSTSRYQAVCVPCECNGHSRVCDQATGKCIKCKHNTSGDSCEKCEKGFFGNPKTGAPDACKPCACPAIGRSLAESCVADPLDYKKHICINCLKGYSGTRCESCSPGYYGDPLRGIPCRPCNCNGNADLNMLDWCNPITGVCTCRFPTTGKNCDRCLDGFYGSAKKGDCKKCGCSDTGSIGKTCDSNGQCRCKPLYTTKNCGQCVPGRGDVDKGCPECVCNPVGTVGMTKCDPVTGNCECKPGIGSKQCSKCKKGFFGFTDKGCKPCFCFSKGSKSISCDQTLGRCDCGANVMGEKCDRCKSLHYWKPNSTDCAMCDCRIGAKYRSCDMNTGQCTCLPNVIGRRCNVCEPGYWGLDKNGCKKCRACPVGQICNPDNGNCECPRHTEGPNCERCKPYAWGFKPDAGCKLCNCSISGSVDALTCDSKTGKCKCKPNFAGRQCSMCNPGFYKSGKCERCQCEPRGSRPDSKVGPALFNCDFLTGQCICKENVEGKQCNTCKKGTFGLSTNYEKGCFSCYCSGVSTICSKAPDWVLKPKNQRLELTQSLNPIKKRNEPIMLPDAPKVIKKDWDMSDRKPLLVSVSQFTGDLTTIYGSRVLEVTIRCEPTCGRISDQESFRGEAIIKSWNRYVIKLNPEPSQAYHQSSSAGVTQDKYPVHMLEKFWRPTRDGDRVISSSSPLSREWLMFLLTNVTSFSIRATTSDVRPKSIAMKLAFGVPTNTTKPVGPDIGSIEKCVCPKELSGLSCQNPAPGYYRVPPKLPRIPDHIPDPVVSPNTTDKTPKTPKPEVRQCQCNGNSKKCNPVTGQCIDCERDTIGDHCEKCRPGFYGEPTKGFPCRACQCPSEKNNFAESCFVDKIFGFTCKCKKGYRGARCELCDAGFHFANGRDGECVPCNCSPQGSVSPTCDENGKCTCFTGITGLKCDRCKPEYALVNRTCVSCKEGCYRELWDNIDKLYKTLDAFNISKLDTEPLKRLQSAEEKYKVVEEKSRKNRVQALKNVMVEANKIRDVVKKREQEISLMKKVSDNQKLKRCEMLNSLPEIKLAVFDLDKRAAEIIQSIKKPFDTSGLPSELLNNARRMVNEMKKGDATASKKSLEDLKKLHEEIKAGLKDLFTKLTIPVTDEGSVLKDLKRRVEDLKRMNDEIEKKLPDAVAKYERLKKQLDATAFNATEGVDKTIAKKLADIKLLKKSAEDINKETIQIMDAINANTGTDKHIKDLNAMINKFNKALADEDLNEVNNKRVNAAFKTNQKIINTKKKLNEILTEDAKGTKAAMAYKNIINAVNEADKATINTAKVVNDVLNKIDEKKLSDNDKMVKDSVQAAKEVADLEKKRNDQKKRLADLMKSVLENKKKVNDQAKTLDKASKGVDVKPISDKLDKILAAQAENRKKIDDLNSNLKNADNDVSGLRNRLDKLKAASMTGDEDLEKSVKDIEAKKKNMDTKLDSLGDAMKNLKKKLSNIQKRMGQMRELIEISHGQVAQDPLPYLVGGGCVRTYRTYYLEPSMVLSLRFWFRMADVPKTDQLIMFGKTPGTTFAFVVEMTKEKQLRIKWRSRLGDTVYTTSTNPKSSSINPKTWTEAILEVSIYQTVIKIREPKIDTKTDVKFNVEKKITSNNVVQDLPWITEKTIISVGGLPVGETRPKDLLPVDPPQFEGCLFAMRINNRAFGPYDMIKASPQCDITKTAQNPLARTSPCKVHFKKLDVAYDDRFSDTKRPIAFYGDGYFKSVQRLVPKAEIFKKMVFNLYPQPFKQPEPSLVLLIYYEAELSQLNYIKVDYMDRTLVLEAKMGVGKCVSKSKQFDSYIKLRASVFEIDFTTATLGLKGLSPACTGIDARTLLSKATGVYVGGVPEYVRKNFAKASVLLSKNFFGCMTFHVVSGDRLGRGPFRLMALEETLPYGITRNAEYSCPAQNTKAVQPVNHVTLKKRRMIDVKQPAIIDSWKSIQNFGFTFSTDQEGKYDLLQMKSGAAIPLKLSVDGSSLVLDIQSTARRIRRQTPKKLKFGGVTIKKNTFYSVFLRVIPVFVKQASVYLVLDSKKEVLDIKNIDILKNIDDIQIGQGSDDSKSDICYRSLVIGETIVDFASVIRNNKAATEAEFQTCRSFGDIMRIPESIPVKAVSTTPVSNREYSANIKFRRHRAPKEDRCGTSPNFKTDSTSVFMEFKGSVLRWEADRPTNNFEVSFKFRTIIDVNQTRVLSGEFRDDRTFLFFIEKNMPKLTLCKKRCFTFMLHAQVTSGSWHTVKIQHSDDDPMGLKFSVDEATRNTEKKFKSRLSTLGFGGTAVDISARNISMVNFGGCLKNILINGKPFPTASNPPKPSMRWRECFACSQFSPGQAYKSVDSRPVSIAKVMFQPAKDWKGGFSVQVEIRPTLENGVVFAMVEEIPISGALLRRFRRLRKRRLRVLRLRRYKRDVDATSFLVFAAFLKDGKINHILTVYDRSSKQMSHANSKTVTLGTAQLGKWTQFSAIEYAESSFSVDLKLVVGSKAKNSVSKDLPSYFKSTDIQLGGHTKLSSEDWYRMLGVRNSFAGCIRKVAFHYARTRYNWIASLQQPNDLSTVKGLHYGGCPDSQ